MRFIAIAPAKSAEEVVQSICWTDYHAGGQDYPSAARQIPDGKYKLGSLEVLAIGVEP